MVDISDKMNTKCVVLMQCARKMQSISYNKHICK